jgi:hypothetical protein
MGRHPATQLKAGTDGAAIDRADPISDAQPRRSRRAAGEDVDDHHAL